MECCPLAHKLGYLLYACTGIFLLLLGLAWSGKAVGPTASADTRSRTDREQPILALTFDDGPHPVYTPQLLDGLEKRNVKVSFFLMGKNIMGNEAIVKRMHEDGHLIGNHTFDHVQLNKLPENEACSQITKTSNAIFEITGQYPAYVRPPFGEWREGLDCTVTMLPVFWDIDPLDWNTDNADQVVEKVVSKAEDGDIILMHDASASSVQAALRVIDILTKKGYVFVTVDRLLLD
jgi:Predicted xylanase/chitin deacetylase